MKLKDWMIATVSDGIIKIFMNGAKDEFRVEEQMQEMIARGIAWFKDYRDLWWDAAQMSPSQINPKREEVDWWFLTEADEKVFETKMMSMV